MEWSPATAAAAAADGTTTTMAMTTTTRTTRPPDEIAELSDRIRRALECPACFEVKPDMEFYCPNGHMVCGQCLIELLARDAVACPMCRSPMSPESGDRVTADRMALALQQLNVACRYRKDGCGVLVRVAAVARHEAACRYQPDVRCLVSGCCWLGLRDRLYAHVSRQHPEAVASTQGDRLVVSDANRITSGRRRTYLVRTDRDDALLWVLMSRESRNRIRTGVFFVESGPPRPERDYDDDNADEARPIDLKYRVTFLGPAVGQTTATTAASASASSQRRGTLSKTRKVGRWHSLLQDADGPDDKTLSYTHFQSREGRVEIKWFDRTVAARRPRTRPRSRTVTRTSAAPTAVTSASLAAAEDAAAVTAAVATMDGGAQE